MRRVLSLRLAPAAALVLAVGATQARAQGDNPPLSADQIAAALQGKLCTTRAGAKFTFTADGHYVYAGLGFTHSGHYRFGDGAVTVLLDNGLERSFAISSNGDRLYMEQTAMRCAGIEKENVTLSAGRSRAALTSGSR
jgi:hypothetical protein